MGTCRPVTLATFRWSREARLCQGWAHSAHPQGLALIEPGLPAIANVLLLGFLKKASCLTLPGKVSSKNSSVWLRQDAYQNSLESYRKTTGFYLRHLQMTRFRTAGIGDYLAAPSRQQAYLLQLR